MRVVKDASKVWPVDKTQCFVNILRYNVFLRFKRWFFS